ncbi:MAG: CDP-alcohol phosphatidyltransferase family protein [Nanoarchaeota archaeon]|nr:CDP-alcohol phosphatidyltransferase family protein [Nanoarchaeota archaeon]
MGINKHLQIPDIFTLLNASFGVLSIYFSVNRVFFLAVASLVVAVLFDYLDGKVARKLNKTHEFGKELDSLSDVISFGVAPAVFGLVYAGSGVYGIWSTVLAASCVIFVLCGALRLA